MRSLALLLCLAGLASAQVTPPDLGTCVALPVTSATSCVRVAVDVPARGPAVEPLASPARAGPARIFFDAPER